MVKLLWFYLIIGYFLCKIAVTPLGGSVDWNYTGGYALVLRVGHSPWWECGLKFLYGILSVCVHKSLPLVGVWIEISKKSIISMTFKVTPLGGSVDWNSLFVFCSDLSNSSLPLVGVWIEIPKFHKPCFPDTGHSPWWECGLKSYIRRIGLIQRLSLPLVGVWIEIQGDRSTSPLRQVTPLGGSVDWNLIFGVPLHCPLCHSPWWECGLKFEF